MACSSRSASRGLIMLIHLLVVASLKPLDLARSRFVFSAHERHPASSSIWPPVCRWNKESGAFEGLTFSRNDDITRKALSFLSVARGGTSNDEAVGESNEETTNGTPTPGASDVLSYYLLWSPGVFQRTCVSIIALFVARVAVLPFRNQLTGLVAAGNKNPIAFLMQIVLIPLLSSACCGIQLAINAFVGAGGCAGFNKRLGPLRPCFLAWLFVATATTFPSPYDSAAALNWVRYSLLRWSVAFMPEMVHLWNIHVAERVKLRENVPESDTFRSTIELTIPTMGCVACINKIDSSLRARAPNQIVEAKSWLEPSGKGGRALVRSSASTREEAQRLAESLVDAVRGAGFEPCVVDTIQVDGEYESKAPCH